jgi:hypothetical protein
MVEKQILRWSYWLGLVCLVVGVIWRLLATVGLMPMALKIVAYTTIYRGGGFLLVVAIASAAHLWAEAQKP